MQSALTLNDAYQNHRTNHTLIMKFPLNYLFLALSTVVTFTANLPAYAKQDDTQFSLSGLVTDEAGNRLPLARVCLTIAIQSDQKPLQLSTVTDQYGQYQFDSDLPKFDEVRGITLRAVADGFAVGQCSYHKPTIVRATNFFPKLLPTKSKRLETNLSLPRRSQKVLTVVDPSNKPLAGAKLISLNELSCFSDNRVILGENSWNALGLEIATSSEQGEFRDLPICDERTYAMVVSHPDFAIGETKLEPTQPPVIKLSHGTVVNITITCDHDQAEAQESQIHVIGNSSVLTFNPNSEGKLQLRLTNAGLASGRSIQIKVDHPRLSPSRPLTYTTGRSQFSFTLWRTGKIKGRVVDLNGNGVAGFLVDPVFASKSPIRHDGDTTVTDSQGEYELEIIENHEVIAVKLSNSGAWADVGLNLLQSIVVEAGKEYTVTDLTATIPRPPFLIKVSGPDLGKPLSSMVVIPSTGSVQLTDENGLASFHARTREMAMQAVDPFRPLSVQQMVKPRLSRSSAIQNGALQGLQTPEEMTLQPERFLRVKMVDEQAQSASPPRIITLEQGTVVHLRHSDQEGVALFDGLAEGDCKLSILGKDRRDKPIHEKTVKLKDRFEFVTVSLPSVNSPRNSTDQPAIEDKPSIPSINGSNWLAGFETTLDCSSNEHLVVCISASIDALNNAALANRLYSGRGFKFVGVWRCMNSEEIFEASSDRSAFPIMIDDARSRIAEKFGVPNGSIEWPYFVIYDSRGIKTVSGAGMGNLIRAVRFEYLSQQK